MMVSYTRARAEGLGIESKGGLMQRPERIITISLSAIACGITAHYIGGDYKVYIPGISFHVFETMSIFTFPLAVMAVMTNITAIRRLMDAKKVLDKQEPKKIRSNNNHLPKAAAILLLASFSLYAFSPAPMTQKKNTTVTSPENFPTPANIKNMLFYIQRTNNTNTIVYQLNMDEQGEVDEDDPVHIFWIRYAENGQQEELSYMQRKFAYGLHTKKLSDGRFELRFVARRGFPFYLNKDTRGNYKVYTHIEGKQLILQKIFVSINGG
jgi:hypothetical protein